MHLRNQLGLSQQMAESLPDGFIKTIGQHTSRGAGLCAGDRQRILTFALVIKVCVLSVIAGLTHAVQGQSALTTFDQRAQQIAVRPWGIHFAGRFSIAGKLQLRLLKNLGRDDGRSIARRPIRSPGDNCALF